MTSPWIVGIDLGTTHTAMARVAAASDARTKVLDVPQLITASTLERRALLPSFVYFAHASEGALALPWDATRSHAVGEHARSRAAESPGRVISSAKSWLSHAGVDRRAPLLPQGAPDDVEKISAVEASWRLLDHLSEAWRYELDPGGTELAAQDVVLTVPASFDAGARDLTVEAAYAAGMENVTLLEEPQAAVYAWIEASGESFRRHLSVGDVILVIDIGGGTTDFSAIAVAESDGDVELRRIAVGDHILLGGDNMDLALAHRVAHRLAADGKKLDRWQLTALGHACRGAKEALLGRPEAASVPVVVPSRGAQLLGASLRTELTRDDVQAVIVDGFFPVVSADARPATRARSALTQIGLPYAADAAVTRHLAAFLARQAGAAATGSRMLSPTAILFNGGVVKAPALRERLLSTLGGWLSDMGAPPPRVLPGEDPDLAVARGAAYYGRVRRSGGLRIRGGTARAYYVGIESPAPAIPGVEPPLSALCVAPFGMEEGTAAPLPPHELGVVVGEPVRFRFFGSSVRRADTAGAAFDDPGDDFDELAPIEITLPAEGRREGDVVPVRLRASITPVGTLLLEAEPLEPLEAGERWKVELGVRGP